MRLMLVEDKDSFRRLLLQALQGSLWEVEAFADPREALARLESEPFDVLVTDLRLPGFSGVELLRMAKRQRPGLRVVLMSAFGEAKDIVEAMRCGADDFLPKPFDLDLFLALLDKLRASVGAPPPDPAEAWIACSPAMREFDRALANAADSPVPILFIGEAGSGKARASRRLHTLAAPRAPYGILGASGLDREGPGAHLLRTLEGGTLYLPELEDLPPAALAGLLRSMDSALGAKLRWMAGARDLGAIPEPLRVRIGTVALRLPPLRDRREDLLPLFRSFLEGAARGEGRLAPALDRSAERQILEHPWPGNLRELGRAAAASLMGAQGGRLRTLSLDADPLGLFITLPEGATLEGMLKEVQHRAEAYLLRRALAEADGLVPEAAARLGLSPRGLALRLREHGIQLES